MSFFGANRAVLVASAVGALTCGACERSEKAEKPAAVEYGEPVGLTLKRAGGEIDYEMAVAISKGKDPSPGVPALAEAMVAAAKACPETRPTLAADNTLRLAFPVLRGKAALPPRLPESPAVTCLLRALEGRKLFGDADDLAVLIELRTAKVEAAK